MLVLYKPYISHLDIEIIAQVEILQLLYRVATNKSTCCSSIVEFLAQRLDLRKEPDVRNSGSFG
jgi:hypothetical protein